MQPKAKSAARLPDTLHPRNRRVQAQSLMEKKFWRHFRNLVSGWNPVFDSGGLVRGTFLDDAPSPGEEGVMAAADARCPERARQKEDRSFSDVFLREAGHAGARQPHHTPATPHLTCLVLQKI